jgi:Uma2 family endonuclease
MAKHIEDEVVYYYDLYPTEEDLMGQTSVHARLIRYLMDTLTWLFWGQRCALYDSLNFYQTPDIYENPLSPDVAVIKGVEMRDMKSWRVGKDGPAPQLVFEILSAKTWKIDIDKKPTHYALMGVQEYFAYDPPVDRDAPGRLSGWRLDPLTRQMHPLPLRANGSLWSQHLNSWLVPAGNLLYLYDPQGRLRLTQAQAEAQRAEAEKRRADAEADARQAEIKRAEAEKRRADAEAKRANALAEKLRSLGIDPNQL